MEQNNSRRCRSRTHPLHDVEITKDGQDAEWISRNCGTSLHMIQQYYADRDIHRVGKKLAKLPS